MTGTTIFVAFIIWLASECLLLALREPNPGVAAREPDNQMQTLGKNEIRPLAFRRLEAHNLSRRDEQQRCSSYGSKDEKFCVAVTKSLMGRGLRSRM